MDWSLGSKCLKSRNRTRHQTGGHARKNQSGARQSSPRLEPSGSAQLWYSGKSNPSEPSPRDWEISRRSSIRSPHNGLSSRESPSGEGGLKSSPAMVELTPEGRKCPLTHHSETKKSERDNKCYISICNKCDIRKKSPLKGRSGNIYS